MSSKKGKPPPEGSLSAPDYFEAAQDHASALSSLYARGDYPLTIYAAGLAAECLFRAFRARKGLPFRSDHPLASLAEEAGLSEMIPVGHRARFDAAHADLILRWRNNHRFRSKTALRRFLKQHKLDRGIKGDYLKENARLLASSAVELAGLGVEQWR
jgi:hypothetical protein